MKNPRILLSLAIASLFATSFAFAAAGEAKAAGCCVKAEKKGEACAHECCAAAAKAGKNCEKCGGAGELAKK